MSGDRAKVRSVGRQLGDCDICGKPRIAKGLCRKHYDEQRATGPRKRQNAKLTADNVREIRHLSADGATLRALGVKFGVSNVTVHNIVSGKSYRDVD